jgi:hypothetical protein
MKGHGDKYPHYSELLVQAIQEIRASGIIRPYERKTK